MKKPELPLLDYTIVICTYNPDHRILERCLQSVAALDRNLLKTEVILVDNNSTQPVKEISIVEELAKTIPGFKTVFVERQGVQFARMAAIDLARGQFIVYIDYDNEPEAGYLQSLKVLNEELPQVAAWGPGQVLVDFIDGIDPEIEQYARISFQEKHHTEIVYDNAPDWQTAYPVGTGLCCVHSVLQEYVHEAKNGRFSLPGRTASSLSSGEDTEMILLAVKKGFYAGIAPSLKLKHIISGSKANVGYIRKLIYGTTSCYDTCLLEVYPEREFQIRNKILKPARFSRRAISRFVRTGFGYRTLKTFDLIHWMALETSSFIALNEPLPAVIRSILKYLKAES